MSQVGVTYSMSSIQEEYSVSFPYGTRQAADRFRTILGCLPIKKPCEFPDEETVAHISMIHISNAS